MEKTGVLSTHCIIEDTCLYLFVGTFIAIEISVYMLDDTGKTNTEKVMKNPQAESI